MNFIDSHAHINDDAVDADSQVLIARVFEIGVFKFMGIACEKEVW